MCVHTTWTRSDARFLTREEHEEWFESSVWFEALSCRDRWTDRMLPGNYLKKRATESRMIRPAPAVCVYSRVDSSASCCDWSTLHTPVTPVRPRCRSDYRLCAAKCQGQRGRGGGAHLYQRSQNFHFHLERRSCARNQFRQYGTERAGFCSKDTNEIFMKRKFQ